jgi:hypothetical protein
MRIGNGAVDALSRKPLVSESCYSLSSCQPLWLDQLTASYKDDQFATELIAKLSVDESAVGNFTWAQGLLRYKQRIWVGSAPDLQNKLIDALHDSMVGGHSGVPVTYRRLKQYFAWKGMNAVVHDYVQSCMICQQAKLEKIKSPRLLQSLPIPTKSW